MVAGKKSTAASSRRRHAQGLRGFWVLGFGIGTIDFHLPFLIFAALCATRSLLDRNKRVMPSENPTPESHDLKPSRSIFHPHQAHMPRHD
jgi:hypothetical protein